MEYLPIHAEYMHVNFIFVSSLCSVGFFLDKWLLKRSEDFLKKSLLRFVLVGKTAIFRGFQAHEERCQIMFYCKGIECTYKLTNSLYLYSVNVVSLSL